MIDYQTAAFHIQDFHAAAGASCKNEYVPVTDVMSRQVFDNATQGIKAFAHICRIGMQIIAHGVIQIKHAINKLIELILSETQE